VKRTVWRPVLAAVGLGCLVAQAGAQAQSAQVSPLDAGAPVASAPYVSPLGGYRHAGEAPVGDWRQANDQVAPAAGDDPHARHTMGGAMPMDMGSGAGMDMKMDMGAGSHASEGVNDSSDHNDMRHDQAQPPATPPADSSIDDAMPPMENRHDHHH
jgi:hypothetical protein